MSLHQSELNEGHVEGDQLRLACSECGRVYHQIAALRGQSMFTVELDYPQVPCHAGMVQVTSPPLDPFVTVQRAFGLLKEDPKFRAIVRLMDGMIVGYSVEHVS